MSYRARSTRIFSKYDGKFAGGGRAFRQCREFYTRAQAFTAASVRQHWFPAHRFASRRYSFVQATLRRLCHASSSSVPRMDSSLQHANANAMDHLRALDTPPAVRAIHAFHLREPALGARVEHVLAEEAGPLSHIVAEALDLPRGFAKELIRFGAVHGCPVHPEPRPEHKDRMDPARLERVMAFRKAALAIKGNKDSRKSQPRRITEDAEMPAGSYVRCHVHPKRFSAVHSVRWEDRVVAQGAEWAVMNKPAGCPVVPAVDNILECLTTCSAKAVGSDVPLMVTHRLDQCTEGLVVMGKGSSAFVAYFNALLRDKSDRVDKVYRTLSARPPPVGTLVHFVKTGNRRPGEPSHTQAFEAEVPGGLRCELCILKVEEVELSGAARCMWGPKGYESTLKLITGRTHQIRAQLAAVGCPLLGDSLYSPLAATQPSGDDDNRSSSARKGMATTAADDDGSPKRLKVSLLTANGDAVAPEGSAAAGFGSVRNENLLPDGSRRLAEPEGGIGLQAYMLKILDPDCPFEGFSRPKDAFVAADPWWRSE